MDVGESLVRVLAHGTQLEYYDYKLKRGVKVKIIHTTPYQFRAQAVTCRHIEGIGFTPHAARIDFWRVLSAVVRTRSEKTPLSVRRFLKRHIQYIEERTPKQA